MQMNIENISKIILMVALLIFATGQVVKAENYVLGELEISNVWARATPGRSRTAAVYIERISNFGQQVDSLIGIRSPIASKISIHQTKIEAGIAKMRPVEELEIHVGRPVSLKPSGLHVMLVGLQQPLKEGSKFSMVLEFKTAGKIEVVVAVKKIGLSGALKIEHKRKHHH
jgi:periplasmic copper chaperone A